ncbi:MAG TPA: cupin domain-containing protein [Erysipelothrix sp.]|nr:cupin domain-containing protein [Erysipelothrix sp.]
MPPHWHRSLDLTYVLKGELNLRIGSELVTYGEDDLFIINSGDIYETSGVIDPNGEIISFIHDNYTDLMTLPSVSKQFHMSREHFA